MFPIFFLFTLFFYISFEEARTNVNVMVNQVELDAAFFRILCVCCTAFFSNTVTLQNRADQLNSGTLKTRFLNLAKQILGHL